MRATPAIEVTSNAYCELLSSLQNLKEPETASRTMFVGVGKTCKGLVLSRSCCLVIVTSAATVLEQ